MTQSTNAISGAAIATAGLTPVGEMPIRLLVVKTSSMGDLVHTLSALQEACTRMPHVKVDWVCEEGFVDIPPLLPCVDRVIPVAIRRWKTSWRSRATRHEIRQFVRALRSRDYDCVIDAQGLIKSAWITALARCPSGSRWGFDWASCREPLASLVARHRVSAPRDWHAIERLRTLFSSALNYTLQGSISWIGCNETGLAKENPLGDEHAQKPFVLFLPGTTRVEKSWPSDCWIALGRLLVCRDYHVLIAWASPQEQHQAVQMAAAIGTGAKPLARQSIRGLASWICHSAAVVGLDSGLMHLSVALGRPTVAVMPAAYLQKYSADRFAPSWAPHARVVKRSSEQAAITPEHVIAALQELLL